ncbi:MAG TPA: hypothetical protein VF469_13065, partial [Kofleriaceae bacterium]
MANQFVDDMSADPALGTPEPAQASAGPIEHAESIASPSPAPASRAERARGRAGTSAKPRSSASKRSPRPEANPDAGKPASRAKPPRATAKEARAAGEQTSGLDRTVEPSGALAILKAPASDPASSGDAWRSGAQASWTASEPDGDANPSRVQITETGEPAEPTSKPDANGKALQADVDGSPEARGTALRRGLPRAGVYRPSAVTRPPRSTPVA